MTTSCPLCNFLLDVNSPPPNRSHYVLCPECGLEFNASPQSFPPSLEPPAARAGTGAIYSGRWDHLLEPENVEQEEVPWENLRQYGLLGAIAQTVKKTSVDSPSFFRAIPPDGPIAPAIIWACLVAATAILLQLSFALIFGIASGFEQLEPLAAQFGGAFAVPLIVLIVVVACFISVPLTFFFSGGLTHLFLRLFKAADFGFSATMRAMCYGNTPMIAQAVPVIGSFIAAIWAPVNITIALKNIHDTTYGRVVLAYLAEIASVIILFGGVFILATFI